MWSPVHKLLKTWQLLASCEGGPSPSWRWHLNCPVLAQWGRPPATAHTLHHTHTFSMAVKGQAQWHKVHTVTFFSRTGANVNACTCTWVHDTHFHQHFLLLFESQFPHCKLSTLAVQTILLLTLSHTHTHTHTHTWIHTHTLEFNHYALMYSGLSLQVTWPLLSCVSGREEPIQPDGSGAEWLRTTGRVNM